MNHAENKFNALLVEAFPATEPTAGLRARILTPKVPSPTRRVLRFAFATAGIAMAIGGTIVLAPRASAYMALSRIERASDALPAWHVASFTPDINGKLVKSGETWCQGDQVRDEREFGHEVLLSNGDSRIEYHPGEDHAVRSDGHGNASGQLKKLSGFIKELDRTTGIMGLSVDRDVTFEGHHATKIEALSKNEPVRFTIYADSKTDIPFLAIVEGRSESDWRLIRRCEIDTSPGPVSFTVPSGVQVLDQQQLQRAMEARLDKPIATYTGPGFEPIKVRDVWMNRDGVVFVLYTNGSSLKPVDTTGWRTVRQPDGREVKQGRAVPQTEMKNYGELSDLKDDLGTPYAKVDGFQGTEYYTDGRFVKGLRWGDEDAVVSVWASANSGPLPKHVTLKFGNTNYVVPKGFKPTGKWVTQDQMVPQHQVFAIHTQALKANSGELPEWSEFLGMAPRPLELEMNIARARCIAAWERGDGMEAEAQAKQYIRFTQQESAEGGSPYVMADHYDLLGRAYALEGKVEQARTAWSKALSDANPMDSDRIHKELSALPSAPH